ncbi:Flp pilus assembly protein CpaB [Mariniblastus sp.]|nr:Flp pilus assembly protein CpaB [Mariniblastus sp.]MDA7906784.1 Flp pilus assembly protein CpaB [Mariniblastus sp.]MDB4372814.1 Flp pilus assembly protein CpaB [Mariniblastus sp.]
MKSKSFMLMVLSMGFGLVAAIGISQVLGQKSANAEPEKAMGPVIVAAVDLDPNTRLTEENVKIENWPLNIIPDDAATSLEDVEDMVNRNRLGKGMPINLSVIVNEKSVASLSIPSDMKVVAIKVPSDDLFGGLLSPGDKVDVIGLFTKRDKKNANRINQTSKTFLRGLQVFSINNSMKSVETREDSPTAGTNSAVVGVLATEEQAEAIYYVLKTAQIKLTLRGEEATNDDDIESLDQIMGWDLIDEDEEDAQSNENIVTVAESDVLNEEQIPPSMTIWSGNSPENYTFTPGLLPQSTIPDINMAPIVPVNSDDTSDDDEADSDGSNEIDRNLEEDQYQGE